MKTKNKEHAEVIGQRLTTQADAKCYIVTRRGRRPWQARESGGVIQCGTEVKVMDAIDARNGTRHTTVFVMINHVDPETNKRALIPLVALSEY